MEIKKAIREAGLTQTSIALRLKITKEHLNSMINGKLDMPDKYKIEILSLINKVNQTV